MTDDPTTLASAYLDGEVTPTERAQVEADQGLLTEVERLRRVRAVLGGSIDETATASISVRERHLAAALEVWDRIPASELTGDATPHGVDAAAAAGTASLTSPGEMHERRQRRARRKTRLLTAAASLIVVAGVGLVIREATSDDGSEDFANDAATETADEFAVEDQLEAGALAAAEDTFSEDAEADAPAAEIAAAPDASGDDAGIVAGPDQAPPEDDLPVLSSDTDLSDFAAGVLEAQAEARVNSTTADTSEEAVADEPAASSDSSDPAPTGDAAVAQTIEPAFDLCDLVDVVLGPAFWAAPGLFDQPIFVGIDQASNEVVAYVEFDCLEVARTPVP
jgi:ribonuclease E